MSINNPSPGSREAADVALETSSPGRDRKGSSPPGVSAKGTARTEAYCGASSPKLDVLMMVNIIQSLTYRALHTLLKPYGTVLRIRLVYEEDFRSNRCYVTFASGEEAQLAFDAVATLPIGSTGFKASLLRSSNVADDDMDYVPNVFEDTLTDQPPRECKSPPPRWFVAYYRDGSGNFIHAARYLEKEIGKIPDENIKKYGKGVLVRAKDTTQSKMLEHLPCPSESMFENVKAHRSFNYSKGCVYNHDLYEFSEEDILRMCPTSVQRVSKMKGTRNMILLTFYGSTVPDRIHIGPLNLTVKRFVDRPLQCFLCYGYGHGKKSCTEILGAATAQL